MFDIGSDEGYMQVRMPAPSRAEAQKGRPDIAFTADQLHVIAHTLSRWADAMDKAQAKKKKEER